MRRHHTRGARFVPELLDQVFAWAVVFESRIALIWRHHIADKCFNPVANLPGNRFIWIGQRYTSSNSKILARPKTSLTKTADRSTSHYSFNLTGASREKTAIVSVKSNNTFVSAQAVPLGQL
jgi:hypothetical protein